MKKIIILAESGADIPLDLATLHNIQVIPMHVIMGDSSYLDGSIPVTEVYDYYKKTKKIPSTSATNPEEFHLLFRLCFNIVLKYSLIKIIGGIVHL